MVLAYNIPGVGEGLTVPREVYRDIFAGTMRYWDDPRIVTANPGLVPRGACHASPGDATLAPMHPPLRLNFPSRIGIGVTPDSAIAQRLYPRLGYRLMAPACSRMSGAAVCIPPKCWTWQSEPVRR